MNYDSNAVYRKHIKPQLFLSIIFLSCFLSFYNVKTSTSKNQAPFPGAYIHSTPVA